MGFFDNIGKALSDVGNTTLKKGKDAVNVSKYNRMISDEEKEISRNYEKIGKLYFEAHSEDFEPGFTELISDVNVSFARIKEYQETLDKLQGIKKCASCGAVLPEGAMYCPDCGTKMPEPEPEEIPEEEHLDDRLYCTECGAVVEPGKKFCIICGAEIEYTQDIEPAAESVDEAADPEMTGTEESADLQQED